jgi:hypothetical protein
VCSILVESVRNPSTTITFSSCAVVKKTGSSDPWIGHALLPLFEGEEPGQTFGVASQLAVHIGGVRQRPAG